MRTNRRLPSLVGIVGFGSLLFAPALAAATYTASRLGTLGGQSTFVQAINNSGQMVGWSQITGTSIRHAFLFTNGTMIDLGAALGGRESLAEDINDSGQVAGFFYPSTNTVPHAFLYSGGSLIDVNPSSATSSIGHAINAHGDTVSAVVIGGVFHAYLMANGTAVDLGTLGGASSQPFGINANGQVTGGADLPGNVTHAFVYANGSMQDLGTLGGTTSFGSGINEAGQVVGRAMLPSGQLHAFRYANGAMSDLGTLGGGQSSAFSINASGDVVGTAETAATVLHAFIYSGGVMVDLNTALVSGLGGAVLTAAEGINDNGQIVAQSCSSPLLCDSFRLDPVVGAKVVALEYHHAGFDHYFITANPDEITKLDNGTFSGWTRTGQSFNVYVDAQPGKNSVCRFFSTAFDPKSSHFYTPDAGECATVKQNSNWQFEGLVFYVGVPDASGSCGSASLPVYRLYNNGMGAAPNHRYTTSLAIRNQMIAQGWIPEGHGPLAVEMCVD